MAKPTRTDRQAVIAQLRKQQGSDRRRNLAFVGICALVAVLIIGAAAYRPVTDWWEGRQLADLALDEIGVPASACQDIETKPAKGAQEHVPVGTPVEYDDAPPAFGAHWNEAGVAPAPFARKFYTPEDRPELEALMHNLEHGYTLLWYDDTIDQDDADLRELKAIADKFSGTDNFRYKFIAVPWTAADESGAGFPEGQHIALTHWSIGGAGESDPDQQVGVWQYCSGISGEALASFMDAYPYFDSPEPNAM